MRRFLLCGLILLSLASNAVAKQRIALVIGNANYSSAPLRNPINDARKMAQSLRQLNFEVIEKHNLNKRLMTQVIRDFGQRLSKSRVGLFYYSGHGMQVNGNNYLIPINSNIQHEDEIPFEAVDANRVLAKMKSARNGLNILLLDACRDNPYQHSFRSNSRGLARMDAPVGTLIAYATAPGKVASDGKGSNGLFTHFLLKHIKQKGLDISEVLRLTRKDVLQASKRQGQTQVPWDSSSLLDRFCFAGCEGNTSNYDVENLPVDSSVRPVKKHSQQWYIDRWRKLQSKPDTRKPQSSNIVKKKQYDNFIDNGNLTITDTKMGLMWKKCSEGQTGNECTGESISYSGYDLKKIKRSFAGYNDWKLPTIEELRSLVYCSNGTTQVESKVNGCEGKNSRNSKFQSPTIVQSIFPNTNNIYWSSSFHNQRNGWVSGWDHLNFSTGKTQRGWVHVGARVRLVRKASL